ncbi:MAG: aminotransferase class I/II-fold pyridoxal phosphate-dependent enzyme, partial [Muribaculaceae bacterium]|nr:aminotransferase class I/II-fold pyridoxal phosphate-dependent enzyme [Muribaculaceae bacterium]
SASASRLLQRHQGQHQALESMLAEMYGKEILLMNSGYHANAGALSALSVKGTLIVSDKLSHASMIDGIRLGAGDSVRFAHNDMDMLRRILKKKASSYDTVIVATESVFSMDGDFVPLHELTAIKKEFPNVLLYVDEAHAFGVFGERGLGLAEAMEVAADIDVLIVTLGKAAAGFGAFIATSPLLRSYLLNSARSFIFSTALPPAVAAWDMLMIEKLCGMKAEREHLQKLAEWFRGELSLLTGSECESRSQIVPVMAGSASGAVRIADALRNSGIDALPIRRPTVPAGGERIRLSLSADLTEKDLRPVLEVLSRVLR